MSWMRKEAKQTHRGNKIKVMSKMMSLNKERMILKILRVKNKIIKKVESPSKKIKRKILLFNMYTKSKIKMKKTK